MNILFTLCQNVMQVKETVWSVVFLDFAVQNVFSGLNVKGLKGV